MKKLIGITLAILLLPLASYAQQPEDNLPETVQIAGLTVINIGGGVTDAAAGDTWGFRYNADHPTATDYAYLSGDGSLDSDNPGDGDIVDLSADPGSDSTDGGNGYKINADDEYIWWSITAENIWNATSGCITGEIYIVNDGTDGTCGIIELYQDWNRRFLFGVNSSRQMVLLYDCRADGCGSAVTTTSTNTVDEDEWDTFQVCWNTAGNVLGSGAGNYTGINVDGNGWEYGTTAINDWGSAPDDLKVGTNDNTAPDDTYYIDNVKVWTTDTID